MDKRVLMNDKDSLVEADEWSIWDNKSKREMLHTGESKTHILGY